mmetsp:Transcript_9448/g.18973  ORF Transcript_9448/g.18973 Transcript_9448/m.18973 type:complete len:214 (+) Transcript_9448:92-733(+)
MLNSGEGGFLITNDAEAGARAAVYAGAYEKLHTKHLMVPPSKVFEDLDLANTLPNYSLRMHAVTAAILRPQIGTIDARREKYNARYYTFVGKVNTQLSQYGVVIPDQLPEVTIVGDSVQLTLEKATGEQIDAVLANAAARGLSVELFGHPTNARYFKNWKFAPADCALPQTERIIKSTIDIRMPLMWEDEDFDTMFSVLVESLVDAGVVPPQE